MLEIKRSFEAYLDRYDLITIIVHQESKDISLPFKINSEELELVKMYQINGATKYECKPNFKIQIGYAYQIEDAIGNSTDLQIGGVIRTRDFDTEFYYEGNDLGITYTKDSTIWKVWAPTASSVKLRIYKDGYEDLFMIRNDKGVWVYEMSKDCDGYEYTFLVCTNLVWREATDPYSLAVTVNSERSIVIDIKKTLEVSLVKSEFTSFTDAIIYEAHIRDVTSQLVDDVAYPGTYKGMLETLHLNKEVGIPYIKSLGITHLELLPFNDYGGVDDLEPNEAYNWGYNPLHYNVPEGSYASNPADPYNRINELKEVIHTLHEKDIRVIMDVVYNHVYIYETSSFEKIVPGYYFRYDGYGVLSNGTGVGNDVASERLMVRKFIVDSVKFWSNEYGIDGFRFDLMGIMDVETLNVIRQTLDTIRPNILMLGEGWDLNTPLPYESKASIHNAWKMPSIAFFNDRFRDVLKGSTFNNNEVGYAFGNSSKVEDVKYLISGSVMKNNDGYSMFSEPVQTINYVECHDNYTMWDKVSQFFESDENKRHQHVLTTAFTLLSQGIPFIHAGQEFFRTKRGMENSYNAHDEINKLDWERKELFKKEGEFIKQLIALRKSHGAFRLATTDEIKYHAEVIPIDEHLIEYHLFNVKKYGKWDEIIIYFNTSSNSKSIALCGDETVLVYNREVNIRGLKEIKNTHWEVLPYSLCVFAR